MWSLTHNYYRVETDQYDLAERSLQKTKARTDLGFLKFLERESLTQEVVERVKAIKSKWSHLAVIGLGGSSLGAKAFLNLAGLNLNEDRVTFFDNSDPLGFEVKWNKLPEIKDVHWLIVSKTGSTVEVLSQLDMVDYRLTELGLSLENQSTVVTQFDGNSMHNFAIEKQVPCLEIPIDLGGRYSFFSASGLLPVLFMNGDLDGIKEGYRWALSDESILKELIASSLCCIKKGKAVSQVWFYRDFTEYFGDWWSQLWAESLGKALNRDGTTALDVTTPVYCRGASAQHSVLQQVMEGQDDKHLLFIECLKKPKGFVGLGSGRFTQELFRPDQTMHDLYLAQLRGTVESLRDSGKLSMGLGVEELDSKSSAALFLVSMLWVASLGECLGIDAFNQPGVELGKQKTRKILKA